jgi:hypothetical protein
MLSIHQAGILQAGDQIFHYLLHEADIDPVNHGLMGHLQPAITRALLADPIGLADPARPLRRLCEILLRICRLRDPYSGSRAERLSERIGTTLERLHATPPSEQHRIESAIDELIERFNRHNAENRILARKLIAQEQGATLQENARQRVNQVMLAAVQRRPLPVLFVRFLEQVWSKYLYITYLRSGVDSTEWTTGLELIQILAHSLEIRGRDEMFRYYASRVTGAMSKLREAAYSIHQDEYLVKNFLEHLDDIHIRILNEQEPDPGGEFVEVRAPSPSLATPETLQDPTPPPEVRALRVGDWYKLRDGKVQRRCILIEKNPQYGYCLFTNLSGIRVARGGFDQIAEAAERGELLRIDASPVFEKALEYSCTRIRSRIPAIRQQAREAERTHQEARRREQEQEAVERLRLEEEKRRAREAQLLLERQRREEARRQQEAEAQAKQARETRRRLLQDTLSQLERMQSGGWLELIREDERRVNCKLGLRLKSSGKMIFVDSLGRKLAEFQPMELAEKVVDGSASILDYGVAFDDTLGGLINQRSEKIHCDEPR